MLVDSTQLILTCRKMTASIMSKEVVGSVLLQVDRDPHAIISQLHVDAFSLRPGAQLCVVLLVVELMSHANQKRPLWLKSFYRFQRLRQAEVRVVRSLLQFRSQVQQR
eukprot:TRINITY_DN6882_c0_g1_i1.p2 TRINITY_DN6882_c0_g1~~TRINITY_DN6882_c0_g1_i1.p2  ORF type:complete len:108 (-),score=8.61 TRINITY_DN6882_c0_g1_i1:323-646(-)